MEKESRAAGDGRLSRGFGTVPGKEKGFNHVKAKNCTQGSSQGQNPSKYFKPNPVEDILPVRPQQQAVSVEIFLGDEEWVETAN